MAHHSAEPANDAGMVLPATVHDDDPAPRRARWLARLFGGGAATHLSPSPRPCPHCGHVPPPPPPVEADDAPSFLRPRRFERKTVWKVGDPAPLFNPMFSDADGRPWRYDKDLLTWICEADNGHIVESARDYYELVSRVGPLTVR